MLRRSLPLLVVLGLLASLVPTATQAQVLRPQRTLFVTPKVGIVSYMGDRDKTIHDFGGDDIGGFPWGAGLELGYQITTRFSVSGAYLVGNYPEIRPPDPVNSSAEEFRQRHTAQLLLRWTAMADRARIAPFIQAGLHGTVGATDDQTGDDLIGIGPLLGLGLDVVLSPRTSLILEANSNLVVPDDAADEIDNRGGGSFDLLNFLGLGFKYNFRSAFTPVEATAIACPTTVQAGQSASFSATTNDERATRPVEYRWDFGDNATGTGLGTSHTFATAGTYTVTFTASNRGTTSTQTCAVTVTPPPVSAEVQNMTANPMTFEACQPTTVSFSAQVRGDQPVTYAWNFGDGTTGTGANATHTYAQAGTYTVTLTVTNPVGTDTQTMTVRAEECASACADVRELNAVYFDRNASTLTEEGRAALRENIDVLKECATLCVRLEGFAAPGERNAQSLSEDRARAVEQFYIDNGISGSRLMAVGMGQVQGMTSKKEGANQARRVDSIPMACDAMGSR